ncbi:phosphopantetheine-binding protein [Azospirillum sp. B510]|uniref:phosphopantetheine-binding protein n=1 Tax=Azospirillum sp. (strain B510) TaxID=137722 RepID=UPI0002D8852A|nr:phosphopantetheine-binding protein [Azospirillum sp. B510]
MTSQDHVVTLISKNFPIVKTDRLSFSEPLEGQGLDSLDLSTLLFAVEEAFGRRIPTDRVSSLRSIDDIAAFIDES